MVWPLWRYPEKWSFPAIEGWSKCWPSSLNHKPHPWIIGVACMVSPLWQGSSKWWPFSVSTENKRWEDCMVLPSWHFQRRHRSWQLGQPELVATQTLTECFYFLVTPESPTLSLPENTQVSLSIYTRIFQHSPEYCSLDKTDAGSKPGDKNGHSQKQTLSERVLEKSIA